jgi:hypothetical protein
MRNIKVNHAQLKRYAEKKLEAYGYRWELCDESQGNELVEPEPSDNGEIVVYTIRGCVEDIFNGGKVRITKDNPRRASVFDVIRIVCDAPNSRVTYQRLCTDHTEVVTKCYNHSFAGSGQRETPVADAEGIFYIINLLPGKRALQFRLHAMNHLVRFLAGDQSLHDELDANAAAQDALSNEHPMKMISELSATYPKSRKYIMKGTRMEGRHIQDYYKKCVAYLLQYTIDSNTYIKVGWTDDLKHRIDTHFSECPLFEVITIIEMDNAFRLEKAFKEKYAVYNQEVSIKGKVKIEFFVGVSAEEAEEGLAELYQELRWQNAQNKELELERMRMETQFEMTKLQLQHELEMKKLELAIAQANSQR